MIQPYSENTEITQTAQNQNWCLPNWSMPLSQLSDSALPIGAFSHSFGLETYVSEQKIHDEKSFISWLRQIINTQLVYSDGLAIRFVTEALEQESLTSVWNIDQRLYAQTLAYQVRKANQAMGKRLLEIALLTTPSPLLSAYEKQISGGVCYGHPAIVIALVGFFLHAPTAAVIAAHAGAVATSLTQNAVRAIPLGQNAGQRALAYVRLDIEKSIQRVQLADPESFGATVPGLEIAQMRHEQLRARMFMS